MVEAEAHLTEEVFPEVDVRQWVLTLPFALRFWTAHNRLLLNAVLSIAQDVIASFYKRKAKEASIAEPLTGSVVFLQRGGSSLNSNLHFHALFLDGVFEKQSLDFCTFAPPTDEEIGAVVARIAKRVIRMLRRKGLLNKPSAEDEEPTWTEDPPDDVHASCIEASIQHRVATGERAGLHVRRIIGRGFLPPILPTA